VEEEIKKLQEGFNTEFTNLKELLETQSKEVKANGETSTKTVKAIEAAEKRIDESKAELDAKTKEFADKQAEMVKTIDEQKARIDELELKFKRPGFAGNGEEIKSPGQLFVESQAYKDMAAKGDVNSAPAIIKNLSYFLKHFDSIDTKQLEIISAITGGNLAAPFRYPEIIAPGIKALRIRDLLNVQTTGTNAIDYVVETGFINRAAPVEEAKTKPQSEIMFELKTEAVKTVAHWISVSRTVLADVSQLQAYINTRLMYGLKLEEEAQILYGNGISPNLTGIWPQATPYLWSTGKLGDTKLDCIRRAATIARLAEYPVNGVVLHPKDWEDIELLKGTDKHYIWIVVTEGGIPRLFRIPVVETTAINSGEALLGAYNLGAMLWDREEGNIRISEHHENFFIKNLVCVLCEERVTLTTFRPESFVAIDFDSEPGLGT